MKLNNHPALSITQEEKLQLSRFATCYTVLFQIQQEIKAGVGPYAATQDSAVRTLENAMAIAMRHTHADS